MKKSASGMYIKSGKSSLNLRAKGGVVPPSVLLNYCGRQQNQQKYVWGFIRLLTQAS